MTKSPIPAERVQNLYRRAGLKTLETIGIGWDVGGWLGPKQAVAVVRENCGQLEWMGIPRTFKIQELWQGGGRFIDLVRLVWPDAPMTLLDQYRAILAIDAPLGFPIGFQELLRWQLPATLQLDREIDSRLGYRDTDRQIYETFAKKPLSASFDKLGNNATVAMYHASRWAEAENFRIVPFQSDDGQHVIIEVYPALVKNIKTRECVPRIMRQLPSGFPAGSDELDAAICAFHALAYGLSGNHADLPELIDPPAKMNQETLTSEGWIYAISPQWLSKQVEPDRR